MVIKNKFWLSIIGLIVEDIGNFNILEPLSALKRLSSLSVEIITLLLFNIIGFELNKLLVSISEKGLILKNQLILPLLLLIE